MLFLGNASSPDIRDAMVKGTIGQLTTPNERREPIPGVWWGADNGCFSPRYVGDEVWMKWLLRHARFASTCLFATAPDVVADAAATLKRSAPHLRPIRDAGYRPALVGQDGLEDLTDHIPWDDINAFFIGGSTEWKLSSEAAALAAEAKSRGKHVHMGRVNSGKRWKYAESIGCDSVDGTFLAFAPDVNLRRLYKWIGYEE